jgi:5'-nucleotidase
MVVTGMLDELPDMVISGINAGANMGDDTVYSGTVAAATEGFLLGIPSIAISLNGRTHAHYATAAQAAVQLVERVRRQPFKTPTLLNVNVPDLPQSEIKGIQTTRLGKRHKAEPVIKMVNPRGDAVYWVGAAGAAADAGPGTDFHAVDNGWISVTPLQVDLTNYGQLDAVKGWLDATAG